MTRSGRDCSDRVNPFIHDTRCDLIEGILEELETEKENGGWTRDSAKKIKNLYDAIVRIRFSFLSLSLESILASTIAWWRSTSLHNLVTGFLGKSQSSRTRHFVSSLATGGQHLPTPLSPLSFHPSTTLFLLSRLFLLGRR